MQRVTVSTGGGWYFHGYNSFGLSLIPFFAGIVMLAYSGRSWLGRLLLLAGLTIIFAGIIMNLHIWFSPTSLFDTLMMLGLLAVGLGLMARAVRPM
jgi:multisubunit Na+/H+ antiporter MnhF subunit